MAGNRARNLWSRKSNAQTTMPPGHVELSGDGFHVIETKLNQLVSENMCVIINLLQRVFES